MKYIFLMLLGILMVSAAFYVGAIQEAVDLSKSEGDVVQVFGIAGAIAFAVGLFGLGRDVFEEWFE